MSNKESKREKFVRIAESRTNKLIHLIQLLGNCSNKATYDYTEKDILDIFNAIEKELKITKQKFDTLDDKFTKFKLKP